MSTTALHKVGYNTNRAPSDEIWADCPFRDLIFGYPLSGYAYHEDFCHPPATGNGLTYTSTGTGNAVAGIAGDLGVLQLKTGSSSNNYAYAGGGTALASMCQMTTNNGSVWFEARLQQADVANCSVFCGLADPLYNTAASITDTTGVLSTTNGNYVGFRTVAATPTAMDAVYATAGTATTVHQTAANGPTATGLTTQLQTIAAATYVKLGMKLLYQSNTVLWYVNGQPISTGALTTATNFPTTKPLTWLVGIKTHTGSNLTVNLDWVRCAYLLKS